MGSIISTSVLLALCLGVWFWSKRNTRADTEVEQNKEREQAPTLAFLKQYSGESVLQLLGYEGRYRTDSLVLAFEQAIQTKMDRQEQLGDGEQIVLAVEAIEREVNAGGYDQFFRNSSKMFAPIVVDALVRIGCPNSARITADAIAALQVKDLLTEQAIDDEMEKDSDDRDSRLGVCDEAYYSNDESIAEHLFEFIKARRGEFHLG